MTVITVTTISYEEVHPLDSAGMIFTIALYRYLVFHIYPCPRPVLPNMLPAVKWSLFLKNRNFMQAIK